MNPLYIYGVPGKLGGAATKIRDLIKILGSDYDITVVLGHVCFKKDPEVIPFLRSLGVKHCFRKDVPKSPGSVAVGICELDFFSSGTAERIKKSGMRLLWSNDMMWPFEGEAEAARNGLIDRVLFVSEVQQKAFGEMYQNIDQTIIPNYITPEDFQFEERRNPVFTIGRLSRPDPCKYPVNFPLFYETLELGEVRYRVQAWSDELKGIYRWHRFGPEWELMPASKIAARTFLSSLDLFVYPLGHTFVESWGRSTVEAMLTGAIPLVQTGHQFHNIIQHEQSGFICDSFADFRYYSQQLCNNYRLRQQLSRQAAAHARKLCDRQTHRRIWQDALSFN